MGPSLTWRYLVPVIVALWWMAQAAGAQQPIIPLDVVPKEEFARDRQWHEAIVVKSRKEAARYFDRKALEQLDKQVDFTKQFLLIFCWRGRPDDMLDCLVAESFPEQIFFSLKSGTSGQSRIQSRVYALRLGVIWRISK
jgi:hypothetical protein